MQMETNWNKIKILFLTAESSPYSKVGGLGDVSGSLPAILSRRYPHRLDFRVVMPFHADLKYQPNTLQEVLRYSCPCLSENQPITVWQDTSVDFPMYFLQNPLLSKTPPYSEDMAFDLEKYTLFSMASLEFCQAMRWQPDILHGNDWHTALAIFQNQLFFSRHGHIPVPKTMLSIHNLPYMGPADSSILERYGIEAADDPDLPEWSRDMPLPMGLSRVDIISTVSNGYAQEMMTPEFGCGLETYLTRHQNKLRGILNGIDQQVWNPGNDPHLVAPFTPATLPVRSLNKHSLFGEYFPQASVDEPLIIWVSRLQPQKGADLLIQSLEMTLEDPWRCIVLGTGDTSLETALQSLAASYPERVQALTRFDNTLAHQLYAGGDMILMPSRYEPCGLSQMFAMRYGCIPIATATGGLKDTITDFTYGMDADGFLFYPAEVDACVAALRNAFKIFNDDPVTWQRMQINAMRKDFSWDRSAEQYMNIYQKLLESEA